MFESTLDIATICLSDPKSTINLGRTYSLRYLSFIIIGLICRYFPLLTFNDVDKGLNDEDVIVLEFRALKGIIENFVFYGGGLRIETVRSE